MATKKTTAKKAPASKAAKNVPAPHRPKKNMVAKGEAAAPKAENADAKPAKSKAAKEKKVSCIDAAAQVLAASKTPMNAKEMIEAMAAKALWVSPGGKTPAATLYSSISREIATKGKDARFTKTERGKFAANK